MIIPVLLAGGSGTRLWPLSRKSYPKQFSKILGNNSLFQESALRTVNSRSLAFSPPITLTTNDFRFIVGEQLQGVGVNPGPILIEPEMRNTAAAILAAALYVYNDDPDAILLVTPSDHVISDIAVFHEAISRGLLSACEGQIVTFGVKPSRPEVGYGYLEISKSSKEKISKCLRFVEKPDTVQAEKMVLSRKFLWNAGIFLFRAKDMVLAFEKYSKSLLLNVQTALENGKPDLGFFRLDPVAWAKCTSISIDYAILEKASNLMVVSFDGHWSDLGSWESVWEEQELDENGVTASDNVTVIKCNNSLFRSENENLHLVGLGVKDLIVVAMPDAVLVASMERAQDVRKVVSNLKAKNVEQAEFSPKDHRPWGWFESLVNGSRFQVKRIHVKTGASLSLQSHQHRSEHWVVVEGTAKVTIGKDIKLLSEGESVYIPLGAIHRLENTGKIPLVLIEIQTGAYLGEDDINRYEDVYSRE